MKIIEVASAIKQDTITFQGDDAIVNLDEVTKEEGFSYTGVYIENAKVYGDEDLVAIAEKFLNKNKLDKLTVTTASGNTFDANETARNNMMSAIMSADFIGMVETNWKLADNNTVAVDLAELKEALALAIKSVGGIAIK